MTSQFIFNSIGKKVTITTVPAHSEQGGKFAHLQPAGKQRHSGTLLTLDFRSYGGMTTRNRYAVLEYKTRCGLVRTMEIPEPTIESIAHQNTRKSRAKAPKATNL